MCFRFYPSRWPKTTEQNLKPRHIASRYLWGMLHCLRGTWMRLRHIFQMRWKRSVTWHLSHKQIPINSSLATPSCSSSSSPSEYQKEPHFKQRQTKQQKVTSFSPQFLSTETCASSPKELPFMCIIIQSIFISNRFYKSIMSKIPTCQVINF